MGPLGRRGRGGRNLHRCSTDGVGHRAGGSPGRVGQNSGDSQLSRVIDDTGGALVLPGGYGRAQYPHRDSGAQQADCDNKKTGAAAPRSRVKSTPAALRVSMGHVAVLPIVPGRSLRGRLGVQGTLYCEGERTESSNRRRNRQKAYKGQLLRIIKEQRAMGLDDDLPASLAQHPRDGVAVIDVFVEPGRRPW